MLSRQVRNSRSFEFTIYLSIMEVAMFAKEQQSFFKISGIHFNLNIILVVLILATVVDMKLNMQNP